jgi:hypothetical protein
MKRSLAGAVLAVGMVGFVPSLLAQAPGPPPTIDYDWDETVQQVFYPVGAIQVKGDILEFRAQQFIFEYLRRDGSWRVRPAQNDVRPSPPRCFPPTKFQAGDLTVAACSDYSHDRAILELRRGSCDGEVLGRYFLWTREEGAKAQVSDPKDVPEVLEYAEAAEPCVSGTTSLQGQLWLAIAHYGGEGSVGVGMLVRLKTAGFAAQFLRPRELVDSSLGPMVAAGGRLWIGTYYCGEGGEYPTHGLVAYVPSSGAVRSYLPANSPIIGRLVLALAAEGERLWVATENGICSVVLPEERWTCWRIVPTVEVTESTPVSSVPAGPPRGTLRAGEYQVLWLKGDWLEVLTPDAVAGWTRPGSIRVGQPPPDDTHELLFNGDPLPPCDFLQGEPQEGARVVAESCRGFVEPSSVAAQNGWAKVWARIGWIKKANLSIVPRLVLERPGKPPSQVF